MADRLRPAEEILRLARNRSADVHAALPGRVAARPLHDQDRRSLQRRRHPARPVRGDPPRGSRGGGRMHGVVDQCRHVFAARPSHPQRDELGVNRSRAARPRRTLGPFLARDEEVGGPERGDGLRQRVRRGLRNRVPLSAVEGSGTGPAGDDAVPGPSGPGVGVRSRE